MPTNQEKLNKLTELLKLVDEGLSRKEFTENFGRILEFLKKLKAKNLTEIENLNKNISNLSDKLKTDNTANLSGLKDQFTKLINQALKEQEDSLNFIRDKVRGLRNGKDGVSPDPKKIALLASELASNELKPLIPTPDTPEQVANKLEELTGDARLKIEAVKDLKEKLEALEARPLGGGGGGFSYIHMMRHFINDETPTGTVNGTNTDFVLQNSINPPSSLKVFVNGMRMRITEDYTLSGRTITFLTAPPTGSIILVDYMK